MSESITERAEALASRLRDGVSYGTDDWDSDARAASVPVSARPVIRLAEMVAELARQVESIARTQAAEPSTGALGRGTGVPGE